MRQGSVVWQIYVSGGICEVTFDRVTVLAERAYDLPQLDASQAEADILRLTIDLGNTTDDFAANKLREAMTEAQARRDAALSLHTPRAA